MEVLLELPGLHVKDIDEDLHVAEDVVPLRGEVVLHEGLLTPTVPEVEDQIAQEPHVRVLHVNGGPQPPRVPGDEVGEDDGPHAGLAGPRLAHQQNLLSVHVKVCK